jgi:hypothetical protein
VKLLLLRFNMTQKMELVNNFSELYKISPNGLHTDRQTQSAYKTFFLTSLGTSTNTLYDSVFHINKIQS